MESCSTPVRRSAGGAGRGRPRPRVMPPGRAPRSTPAPPRPTPRARREAGRTGDHDHRESEGPGGLDLGPRGGSSAVLRYDDVDRVRLEQAALGVETERPARENDLKARGVACDSGRLHRPDDEEDPRHPEKGPEIPAPDRQQHPLAEGGQLPGGARGIGGIDPAVLGLAPPGRAMEHEARHRCAVTGNGGVGGDRFRVRMRRVDDDTDLRLPKVRLEPARAAEPPRAGRGRHRDGPARAPGERVRRLDPRVAVERAGELDRLPGPAKEEQSNHLPERGRPRRDRR